MKFLGSCLALGCGLLVASVASAIPISMTPTPNTVGTGGWIAMWTLVGPADTNDADITFEISLTVPDTVGTATLVTQVSFDAVLATPGSVSCGSCTVVTDSDSADLSYLNPSSVTDTIQWTTAMPAFGSQSVDVLFTIDPVGANANSGSGTLNVVPEPGVSGLLGLSSLAGGLAARRRRQATTVRVDASV